MIDETDLHWLFAYNLRLGDVIWSELECFGISCFYVYLENDSSNLRQNSLGFWRKHLFNTTCYETRCLKVRKLYKLSYWGQCRDII